MTDPAVLRFYTRPGCGFSMRLRRQLDQAGVAYEPVDIWSDGDAAAVVRGVARGHETVPTLLLGDRAMVNPRLHEVLDVLEADAPHLLPEGRVS